MPVCCRIRLCCPDEAAAADLAAHEQIPLEAAVKIHAGYQLVPRSIEAGPEAVLEGHVTSAQERLSKLLRYARAELRAILMMDAGHEVKEES